jgi:hypothetical protein
LEGKPTCRYFRQFFWFQNVKYNNWETYHG